MIKENLKPCPFCGSKVEIIKREVTCFGDPYNVWYMSCKNLDCLQFESYQDKNKERIIRRWQKRVAN